MKCVMTRNDLIETLHIVFQIIQLDLLIKEYEDKMKIQDGPGQSNQGTPETSGT